MPPRTRNRADRYRLGLDGQELIITEEKYLVSRHLQTQFLAMMRQLKHEVQCPICLWNPLDEAIEKGMCLRLCGHVQCCSCMLQQLDQEDASCPLCRS